MWGKIATSVTQVINAPEGKEVRIEFFSRNGTGLSQRCFLDAGYYSHRGHPRSTIHTLDPFKG